MYCCVFRDEHWGSAKRHYEAGGFVAYFGIEGMFNAPAKLSKIFDVRWTYSAYTAHEHRLTPVGIQCLGDGVTGQGCTKANMISAPKEDRIIIGKAMTLEEYLYDLTGLDASTVDVDQLDDDDREEYAAARDVHHPRHCEEMENRASLAMHEHPGHGGRIAYLGYVNGNGNIPIFVRALLTGEKNRTSSLEDLTATAHSRDCIECDNPSCYRSGNHVDDDDNGLPPLGDIDEEEEEEKESLQKYDIDDDDDDAEERELECVASNRPGNRVNNDNDDDDDGDDNDPRPLADIDEKYEEVEEEEDKEKRRFNYPGITVDEFGHTFCSAHRRPWCHICGVSFVEMNEETDHNLSDRK